MKFKFIVVLAASALVFGYSMVCPAGSSAADLMHNSQDTGSTKWQTQGGWGIAGGKYGQFTCATCHEPDADNIKNIRRTINTMNGSNWPNGTPAATVYFLNQTSMGDDTVRRTSSMRICEVCHSQNRFHNYSTTSNLTHGGALGHPAPKQVCTNCHKHNTGFKAACGGCHGNPPTTTAIGGDYGLVGTPRASNALEPGQAGAHVTHVQTRSMVCDTCHYINNGGVKMPNQSGNIQIGFFGFGGKVTSGTYAPYTSATRGFPFRSGTALTTIAPAQTTYANANKCSNVYCHGGGSAPDGKAPLTGGVNQTPRWDASGQNACGNCHGTSAASPPTMGSHLKHAGASGGYSYICETCHPDNNDNSHVQGNVRWYFNSLNNDPRVASATYQAAGQGTAQHIGSTGNLAPSASYGQCFSVLCHTDGKGGVPRITPTWGSPLPTDCSGCHGGTSTSVAPIATGKHMAHINNAAVLGADFTCGDCHAKTATGNAVSSTTFHANTLMDYSGARAGKSSTYSAGVCSATYCHTDGKGTSKSMTTAGWNSAATIDCTGCHGSDAAPAFTSTAGEPNYVNAGAGATRANSHQKHVGTAGASSCSSCHGPTMSGTALDNSGKHLDRTIDVAQGNGKTFTWVGGTKNCSNISCHGAGSVAAQWGATMPVDCTGCHGGNTSAATAISSGTHTAHVNNAAIIGTNLGCADCHAKTVSADRTISNSTNHANTFVDFSGAKAGRSSSYSAGVCSATYCHTDGKGLAKNMAATAWNSGATMLCTGCHGSDPSPSFTSQAGEPNYATAGANQLRSNSHKAHTSTGANTCVNCHSTTVAVAGTSIASGVLTHINRLIDVFQGGGNTFTWSAGTKSCSNISCHSGGSANWGDASSAGCKVCHATLSGAHAAHVADLVTAGTVSFYNYTSNKSSGTVYRFGCANCHPTDSTKHRNGTVDITLNKNKVGGGSQVALNNLVTTDTAGYTKGGPTNFTCELSYCHSNGKSLTQVSGDYRQSPNWYGGPFTGNKCGMCHDNPPQYAGQSHYVAASSLGNNGTPPYRDSGHMIGIHFKNNSKGNSRNGFLGYSSAGDKAHGNPAYATTISCYICHSGVVSSTQIDTYAMDNTTSKFRCGSCHTASTATPLQVGQIIDTSKHINGSKNVVFAPITFKTKAQLANVANALGWTRTGSYKAAGTFDSFDLSVATWNPATKTCLTACHVNQPNIVWGAALQCVSCHANQ